MLQLRPTLMILALLSVAACSSLGDTFQVTPFLREQITGDTKRACSAREYQAQVRFALRDNRDWLEASRLSAKGWAALRGETVVRWEALQFGLKETRLGAAQLELDTELRHPAAMPCACARAEAAYDGWLAAAARGANNQDQVEKNFRDALVACQRKEG